MEKSPLDVERAGGLGVGVGGCDLIQEQRRREKSFHSEPEQRP